MKHIGTEYAQPLLQRVDKRITTKSTLRCVRGKYVAEIKHSFLISNSRRVLNVVCFLLGESPASEFYMLTFRNTLFHLHRQVGTCRMNSAGEKFGVLYGKRPSPRQTFSRKIPQTCPQPSSFYTHLPAYEDGTDSVPKRRHINFRRRGTTQKKAYNNRNDSV